MRKKIVEWYQAQIDGKKLPCPRCGGEMNSILSHNALSRRDIIYVCNKCGINEALEDASLVVNPGFVKLPLSRWYINLIDKYEELTCHHVGQVFDKKLGGDGAIFEMIEDMGYIYIGFTDISEEEISVINSGKLDISLSVIDGVVFITAVFDDQLIMDMPFYAGLYNEFNIKDPTPYGYTVPIIVMENRTNVIKALRVVGFDPAFSAKLYSLAKEQWENKLTDYDIRLHNILISYLPNEIIKAAIMKNKVEITL